MVTWSPVRYGLRWRDSTEATRRRKDLGGGDVVPEPPHGLLTGGGGTQGALVSRHTVFMATDHQAPAHLRALLRHVEDLRDGTHGGAGARADKEAVFERAVSWVAPVARRVLEEVNEVVLLSSGAIADSELQREEDGTLMRSWTLGWPEQDERGVAPVTLRAWFGSGFHHPHLRGATVHDWPLNVYAEDDARDLLPLLHGIVTADLHNLVFQADWRIIPWATSGG